MTTELHDEIVDDIRFSISDLFCKTNGKIGMWAEAIMANIMMGTKGIGLMADGYIFIEDDCGPMVLEVGKMKDGKWSRFISANDKLPVRVLRVGFDRSIWLLNPRNTELEKVAFDHFKEALKGVSP